MNTTQLRHAGTDDLPQMIRLLEEASLSADGVAAFLADFRVMVDGPELVGTVGIEHYGADGLLRSLAVARSARSRGIGRVLTAQAIDDARQLGIRRLVLLTTTAAEFFERQGWRRIDRAGVTGEITTSSQFRGACPASAICMELTL